MSSNSKEVDFQVILKTGIECGRRSKSYCIIHENIGSRDVHSQWTSLCRSYAEKTGQLMSFRSFNKIENV